MARPILRKRGGAFWAQENSIKATNSMNTKNIDTPLEAISPTEHSSGFLISMSDGTKYLIPVERMIERRINSILNWSDDDYDLPVTPEQAREWSEKKFSHPMHPEDIDELFEGTEWWEFADIAIKLPHKPLSKHDLWETAKISFNPNNLAKPL